MTEAIVVTTKDKLVDVIQNDEKSIIIRGELAEDIKRKLKFRKIIIISLFVFAASLLIVPCVRLFVYPQTLSVATYQTQEFGDDTDLQPSTTDSPKRLFKTQLKTEEDDKKISPIDQITEYTKKDIFSINLGLGLLVILSICSLLHKIINKYEEILFKVEGKLEIHLVHK